MIRIRLGGSAISQTLAQAVQLGDLTATLGPSEFILGTPTPTLIADLTVAASSQANVSIYNRSGFEIFWSYGGVAAPALTTLNGVSLPANSFLTLDGVGGLAIWAITGTPQAAGSGTRVTAGYIA